MMALIGTLAYEFQVVLPVLARDAFHGNASTYVFMTSAMGVGAVIGGLVTAGRGRIGLRPLTVNAAAFGLLILVAAVAPTLAVEMVALVGVGACEHERRKRDEKGMAVLWTAVLHGRWRFVGPPEPS